VSVVTTAKPPFDNFPTAHGDEVVELRQLLTNLGSTVATVLTAPKGLDVAVGEPYIYDPIGDARIEPGAIVLAVGTRPDSTEARDLTVAAGEAGASVVAFKMHDRDFRWVKEADGAGVAVISVSDEMSWSHLNALLALTIPSLGQSSAIPGMASAPLGDLFALSNAIAALVQGAITIEDQRGRVLAYSNLKDQEIDEPRQQSILGRQVPDTPEVRELYKKLWSSDSLIRVETIAQLDSLPRIAAPITVGTQKLGSIWAIEGKTKLGAEAERALVEAARVAALHLIHARSAREIERGIKGDLLRSLLEGRGDVNAAATRLGIPRHVPLVVCAFEIVADGPVEELHRERLVDLVATYSDAFRLQAASVAVGRTVFCLMPLTKQMKAHRVREITKEIQENAAGTLGLPINAGIASLVTEVRDVVDASREVERILRVLSHENSSGRIASIEDVRSGVTLLTLRELARDHPDLTRGAIETIAEHDAEKNTTYLDTLRAYLAFFGDIPAAAEAINVHPNTFRYRMRRLGDLFGIDISNAEDRLVLELQLRLLDG
jgi:DNA-binding PucR family transcriptional regulator